jgi:two-component system, OmpR family, sensor histidine kinase BaeS
LSLSDLGGLSYRKAVLDPVALLGTTLAAYRSRFSGRQLTLFDKLPDAGTLSLHGDVERLRQLYENLLENSLRYTDAGGTLEVALTDLGSEIEVIFRDSAPGVAEADLPRLFERLYRVEESRNRASGGSGLGLTICRNIVAAHGGTIHATASALGGVQMTLRLPKGGP